MTARMIFKKPEGTSKYTGITEQHRAMPSTLRIARPGLQLASMRGTARPRRSYQHGRQSHLYASNRCPPGIRLILFHPNRDQSKSTVWPGPTERNRLIVTVPVSSVPALRKAYHQVPERPANPPYSVAGRMDFPALR